MLEDRADENGSLERLGKSERRAIYVTEALVEIRDNASILSYLSKDETDKVLRAAIRRRYLTGETVFRQGDPHHGIFLIEAGRAQTFYLAPSGKKITLAYWTPGHFVGGPEIFGGGYHIWSAVAAEPSTISFLKGPAIRTLMEEIPKFAIGLIEGLVYKGKCYSELLQLLGTRSVTSRLAHMLLTLATRIGVPFDEKVIIGEIFSHEELADMIGATRQWVTITLRRFEDRGLIAVQNRRIAILDRQGLMELSSH